MVGSTFIKTVHSQKATTPIGCQASSILIHPPHSQSPARSRLAKEFHVWSCPWSQSCSYLASWKSVLARPSNWSEGLGFECKACMWWIQGMMLHDIAKLSANICNVISSWEIILNITQHFLVYFGPHATFHKSVGALSFWPVRDNPELLGLGAATTRFSAWSWSRDEISDA